MSGLESSVNRSQNVDLKSILQDYSFTSQLSHALLLIDNGEYKLAQNILIALLGREPQNFQAMKWLGYCFDQAKDYKNALICYKQWNRLETNEQSFLQLGLAHLNVENFNLAKENLVKALELIDYESPNLFDIYKHLGNLSLRFGDIEDAEEHYNRAYTLSPHSDILIVNMGTLEIQKGDWAQATLYFRNAIHLNKQNDNAWIGLAMSYRNMSDHALANGALEKGLDLNPLNLIGLRLALEWALSDMKYDSAIQRFKVYMAENGHDVDMSFCLATLLFKASHIRDAMLEIQRTREFAPQREDAIQLEAMLQKRTEL